jgi:hypothetical protein
MGRGVSVAVAGVVGGTTSVAVAAGAKVGEGGAGVAVAATTGAGVEGTAVGRGAGLPAWQAAVSAISDKNKSPYRLILRVIGYLVS